MNPEEWITAIVVGLGEATTAQVARRLPFLSGHELHHGLKAAHDRARIRRVDCGTKLSIAVWAGPLEKRAPLTSVWDLATATQTVVL